jgi:hypothetical protein
MAPRTRSATRAAVAVAIDAAHGESKIWTEADYACAALVNVAGGRDGRDDYQVCLQAHAALSQPIGNGWTLTLARLVAAETARWVMDAGRPVALAVQMPLSGVPDNFDLYHGALFGWHVAADVLGNCSTVYLAPLPFLRVDLSCTTYEYALLTDAEAPPHVQKARQLCCTRYELQLD